MAVADPAKVLAEAFGPFKAVLKSCQRILTISVLHARYQV